MSSARKISLALAAFGLAAPLLLSGCGGDDKKLTYSYVCSDGYVSTAADPKTAYSTCTVLHGGTKQTEPNVSGSAEAFEAQREREKLMTYPTPLPTVR